MEQRNLTDTACKLYGTKSCALLNMRACEACPLKGREADPEIHTDLRTFCELQPEGTVAQLFESETCTLCTTEPKGTPTCFAVFDMAHEEPKKLATRKWLSKQKTGFMVPLQFACCSKCRRRILLAEYLPLIAPIVLTAIVLPFVLIEKTAQTLRAAAQIRIGHDRGRTQASDRCGDGGKGMASAVRRAPAAPRVHEEAHRQGPRQRAERRVRSAGRAGNGRKNFRLTRLTLSVTLTIWRCLRQSTAKTLFFRKKRG